MPIKVRRPYLSKPMVRPGIPLPRMDPVPKIPGYEILAPLGGGPLTLVYRGWDSEADQPCAIKIVRADSPDAATAKQLLRREARALLAVNHAHLPHIRAAHVLKAPHYLVMDLVEGETLRQRLRRVFRLDVATAVWVTRQTAEALAALHRAGFQHGDVKPDNVRLAQDGMATLIDLGFAHRPGENDAYMKEGYIMGTLDYLAPELCASPTYDDFASDLFSLGVMLFEMLTGTLPYRRGSLRQTFRRHACDPPRDVLSLCPGISPALATLVRRLLVREPEARPRITSVISQLVALEIRNLRRRAA